MCGSNKALCHGTFNRALREEKRGTGCFIALPFRHKLLQLQAFLA